MPKAVETRVIDKNYSFIKMVNKEMHKVYTDVGFPKGAKVAPPTNESKTDTPPVNKIEEMILIAIVQVLGSTKKKIPKRDFMSYAWFQNNAELKRLTGKIVKRIYGKEITAEQGIKTIGEWMVDKTKDAINNGPWKANKKSTIKAKGSSQPLIDRGQMVNTVTQKVGGTPKFGGSK